MSFKKTFLLIHTLCYNSDKVFIFFLYQKAGGFIVKTSESLIAVRNIQPTTCLNTENEGGL